MSSTKRGAALAAAVVAVVTTWSLASMASGPASLPQEPPVQYAGRLSGSLAVQYHNLDDVRMASTSVVRATAVRRSTFTPAEVPPYTMVEVRVAELIAGQPVAETVTVRQRGGPQFVMDYPWSQIMLPGREYVLFLADVHAADGHYALAGGAYERQEDGRFTLREPDLLPATADYGQLRAAPSVGSVAPVLPGLAGCRAGVRAGRVPALPGAARTARQILDAVGAVRGDARAGVTVDGWQVYTVVNDAEKPVAHYVFRLHESGAGAVLHALSVCA